MDAYENWRDCYGHYNTDRKLALELLHQGKASEYRRVVARAQGWLERSRASRREAEKTMGCDSCGRVFPVDELTKAYGSDTWHCRDCTTPEGR